MSIGMLCPLRIPGSIKDGDGEQPDRWEIREKSIDKNKDLFCSHCGSLHPDRFLFLVENGCSIIPTDKSYKAILVNNNEWYKFYFSHMAPEQAGILLHLYEQKRLKIEHPGFFYKYPLFKLIVDSAPILSFGTIVRLEKGVDDGSIITMINPIYKRILQEISRNPDFIYQIDPRKWEEMIAASYDHEGFDEVILTHRSGDLGRDVIAIKKGFGSLKFVEQVKAYKPTHIVTADEVRALLGVLQAEHDATKAIFTTTSSFAPRLKDDRLIKPFLPYRLELVDKEGLIERLTIAYKDST